MAVLEKIVDPGATGDYTSLAAYFAAYGGVAASGDLVGEDKIARATCKCTNGAADAPATCAGWASFDRDHYVEIAVDPVYQHLGVWPAGSPNIYRLFADVAEPDTGHSLQVINMNLKIRGVAMKYLTHAGANGITWAFNAALADADVLRLEVDDCLFDMHEAEELGYGVQMTFVGSTAFTEGAADLMFRNNLFYIFDDEAGSPYVNRCIEETASTGTTAKPRIVVVHNTFTGGVHAIYTTNNWDVYAKNNLFWGNKTADITSSGTVTADGNASARATGTHLVDLTGIAAGSLFVDPANGLWLPRRAAGNPIYHAGQDVHADAVCPVTDDFLGLTRPAAAPTIGFAELFLRSFNQGKVARCASSGRTIVRR